MAHTLRVLGPPGVLDGDGNPVSLSLGKPLALLVYVACQNSPVSRDEVADLLWPEADRHKGRHSVRQALWVLRNALGEEIFEGDDPLSLRAGALELDLRCFLEALSTGEVEEAQALWRGPTLDQFGLAGARHWNHWLEDLRGDLEHRFCRALLQHARILAEAGEPDAAVSALNQTVEISPQAETPHLARISLLLDLGRLDGAREALADAHRMIGDQPNLSVQLAAVEERLEQIVLEQRSRVAEGEAFPMEFVGRSRELAGLQALWREAEKGRTRIGLITGPSGIGKTRLSQELISYVSGYEIRAVSVRGVRAEMRLRWAAASDFVRQLLRHPGSAGISSASDSLLRAMLPSLGRGEVNLQTVNGVSPAAIFDAVSDLLEAVSYEAPLVALVDDFQWLDPESRTLFVGLANRCREQRVLFLFMGRADLSSRHWEQVEAGLMSEAGATRFLLNPLIEEEVGELLVLGAAFPNPGEATSVVKKIFEASAGNPLFIREILKELHEQGILQREVGGWVFETSQIPGEFELPENIRHLLRERLDRLSEPAASLAAILAREERGKSSEFLQRETQLPPAVFTQAVAELIERGVIEWVDGTSLDFVHEVLRDTASAFLTGSFPEPLPGRGRWSRKWTIGVAGFGILAALLVGVLWGQGVFSWDSEPTPPPYGGGTIVFRRGESSFFTLGVVDAPLEEWKPVQLEPRPPDRTRVVFRDQDGGLIFFGANHTDDGPDLVRITPDGTRVPFFPGPGDQVFLDSSPEGRRVLFSSENVEQEPFSQSLYWAALSPGSTRHLIYRGSGPVRHGQWSPDGDMVAFNMVGASDSLAVYSLAGDRLGAWDFGEIANLDWCGDLIVLSAPFEGEPHLFGVNLMTEEVTPIGPLAIPGSFSCSPDGTALILLDVIDGRANFVIRDLVTGDIRPFPAWDIHYGNASWIPDSVPTVPTGVRAGRDTVRIRWGEKRRLTASVIYSDGSESPDGIWWESLDPAVANFDSGQELTGNRAGSTTVLARRTHSLRDTVVVIVEDAEPHAPTSILREQWDSLYMTRWRPVGSHPPRVRTLDGSQVLELRGGEKYADGLVFMDAIALTQGVTVELEFRMDVNRNVHQDLQLCLMGIDPAAVEEHSARVPFGRDGACFLYPSRDLDKMDPSDISFRVTPGVETRVQLPETLPSSAWTHVAIQVRADGECSLVIDRERVATSPLLLPTLPQGQWTIVLTGAAVGTQLFIRNLNIWREVRY